MAKKAVTLKKKVVVRKTAAPKTIERKAKSSSESKVRKNPPHKKIQTAEGWKREMTRQRREKQEKVSRKR